MKQYRTFGFDACSFDPESGKIALCYSLDDDLRFTETIHLPATLRLRSGRANYQLQAPQYDKGRLNASLQALHLIAGVSYYKTCLPKNIEVRSGHLTAEQAAFWNRIYEKGLGEFYFQNSIDFRNLIHFPNTQQTAVSRQPFAPTPYPLPPTPYTLPPTPKLLVPIGGGKDSTVTIELLKKAGYDITLLRIGRHPLIDAAAEVAGLSILTVERRLDPLLFTLNAEGALNGHVPITAYLSILAVFIAELYGFDSVVMSNERSANEGNVEYLGEMINHQWSKSIECERMLQEYLRNIGSPVQYFSLLRPLSELAIAKHFAQMPQYFACTTSCNRNWKLLPKSEVRSPKSAVGRWCGTCPKCAFTFSLLAAFLPMHTLLRIFDGNLFDEEALLPLYRRLLGIEGFKPFECVGTPEEVQAAFLLAEERNDLAASPAMRLFLREVKPTIRDPRKLIADALAPSADHCIPENILPTIPDVLSPKS